MAEDGGKYVIVRSKTADRYWVWAKRPDRTDVWDPRLGAGRVYEIKHGAELDADNLRLRYNQGDVLVWVLTLEEAQQKWIEQEIENG